MYYLPNCACYSPRLYLPKKPNKKDWLVSTDQAADIIQYPLYTITLFHFYLSLAKQALLLL